MTNTLEKLKEVVKTNQDFKQQLEDVWSSITEALEKKKLRILNIILIILIIKI